MQHRSALLFLAAALPVWVFLCWRLSRLRRVANAARTPLGPATAITLVRGLLIAGVAGFFFLDAAGAAAWIPGPLYATAALLDRLDGAFARRTASVSALGAALDVSTDAVGLLVAPLVAVRWERLPPWYLALSLAYPLFRAALALRLRLGLPTFPERLRPDPRARFFAGVQMAFVAAALFPVLPRWLLWPAATVVMLPTLALFAGQWRLVTRARREEPARRAV